MDVNQFKETKQFWKREVARGNLVWPDETVIRFVHRNFADNATLMDYGCGAGRHSVALASEGYKMIAVDYNEETLQIVETKKGNLPIETIHSDMLEKPMLAKEADGIIAHGSMFYSDAETTIRILKNLYQCMKSGGKMWANWRTREDSLFQSASQRKDGLYDVCFGEETCSYHFPTKQELEQLYVAAGFKIESIDTFTYTESNGAKNCSWYHIIVQK